SDFEPVLKTTPQLKTLTMVDTRAGHDMGFNVAKPPLDDLRVRQAMLKALDFQAGIDTVLTGKGELTTGIVLPDESWKLPKEELQRLFKRDVEGAKRLMREAGKEAGFSAECIFVPVFSSGAFQTYSELFQQQLRDINVTLTLKPVEPAVFNELTLRGDYQIYVHTQLGQSSANADLLGRYHSKGPANVTRFADPKLDDLLEKQAVLSRDPEGRKKLLEEVQRYVVDRAFKIGIAWPATASMYWPYVKDLWPPQHTVYSGDYWTSVWLDK